MTRVNDRTDLSPCRLFCPDRRSGFLSGFPSRRTFTRFAPFCSRGMELLRGGFTRVEKSRQVRNFDLQIERTPRDFEWAFLRRESGHLTQIDRERAVPHETGTQSRKSSDNIGRSWLRMKRKTTAADLGIDLASKKEEELFKWFLACLLFGKPIQTSVAEQAYRRLVAARLLSPDAILRAGWNELVRLLDEAHYVRYDYSTATKLLEISGELKRRYGNVTNLIAQSKTPRELSAKLQEFKNVGPVTARIFLREVRPYWYLPTRPQKAGSHRNKRLRQQPAKAPKE